MHIYHHGWHYDRKSFACLIIAIMIIIIIIQYLYSSRLSCNDMSHDMLNNIHSTQQRQQQTFRSTKRVYAYFTRVHACIKETCLVQFSKDKNPNKK